MKKKIIIDNFIMIPSSILETFLPAKAILLLEIPIYNSKQWSYAYYAEKLNHLLEQLPNY